MVRPSDESSSNPVSELVEGVLSYDGNVMLAALVSLLLVVLFVLLLHLYAKWFLARRSRTLSRVPDPTRIRRDFHAFAFDLSSSSSSSSAAAKGLDPSVISAVPLFVHRSEDGGLECVICLTAFDDREIGRDLPKCHHAFHVDCIDMWLASHSTCPICRAPVVAAATVSDGGKSSESVGPAGNVDGGGTDSSSGTASAVVVVDGSAGVDDCGSESALEIAIEISNHFGNVGIGSDCVSSSPSSSSSSSFGCSLKRMLSRNRSEKKVYPASRVDES